MTLTLSHLVALNPGSQCCQRFFLTIACGCNPTLSPFGHPLGHRPKHGVESGCQVCGSCPWGLTGPRVADRDSSVSDPCQPLPEDPVCSSLR